MEVNDSYLENPLNLVIYHRWRGRTLRKEIKTIGLTALRGLATQNSFNVIDSLLAFIVIHKALSISRLLFVHILCSKASYC